jgi:hypothetical protein
MNIFLKLKKNRSFKNTIIRYLQFYPTDKDKNLKLFLHYD